MPASREREREREQERCRFASQARISNLRPTFVTVAYCRHLLTTEQRSVVVARETLAAS